MKENVMLKYQGLRSGSSMRTRAASTLAVAALAMGLAALAGCASQGAHPPAPAQVASADYRYKIGPLDAISIVVWRNPELSSSLIVRPDGRISTPLVQDLMASGRSPGELAGEIEKVLAKVIREPQVTVVVSGFQGVYSEQIRIVGEAAKPQAVPFRQDMTILDVMIQVGGITDFADGNAAVLVRGSEGGKQYSLRLKDLLKRGDITANAPMQPGDIVIVPQSWF
jgi:polysaccharide biosynthesis/export protein